jgi:hypothetical protein
MSHTQHEQGLPPPGGGVIPGQDQFDHEDPGSVDASTYVVVDPDTGLTLDPPPPEPGPEEDERAFENDEVGPPVISSFFVRPSQPRSS